MYEDNNAAISIAHGADKTDVGRHVYESFTSRGLLPLSRLDGRGIRARRLIKNMSFILWMRPQTQMRHTRAGDPELNIKKVVVWILEESSARHLTSPSAL